jgi:hypothetical protein
MIKEIHNFNKTGKNGQVEIDFNKVPEKQSKEDFEKEKLEIARKFGVGNSDFLNKKDGQWHILYFGDEISIEEWKRKMDELDDKSTNTIANQENWHH